MSDTYTTGSDLLTIYHADTAEERSCTQEEFDTIFEPAGGWEIIEPIADVDPLASISITNPETGETKTVTGAEWLELKAAGGPWRPGEVPPPTRRGGRKVGLRTEEKGRDEERR